LAKKPAKDFTLDQLTHVMGNAEPGSQSHTEMLGELTRRQTIAQLEATEAQKAAAVAEQQAAQAAIETAIRHCIGCVGHHHGCGCRLQRIRF